jgi:hypothetical protein
VFSLSYVAAVPACGFLWDVELQADGSECQHNRHAGVDKVQAVRLSLPVLSICPSTVTGYCVVFLNPYVHPNCLSFLVLVELEDIRHGVLIIDCKDRQALLA